MDQIKLTISYWNIKVYADVLRWLYEYTARIKFKQILQDGLEKPTYP